MPASARPVAVDLDGALGDTRPLWRDWLASAAAVLPLDPASLPDDRAAAAAALDAAGGNWRTLLGRFAEDRAPVYLRPDAAASAALRRLAAAGRPAAAFTDAPEELARVAAAQLGAARRLASLHAGAGALEHAVAALGGDPLVVRTAAELGAAAAG